MGRAFSNYLVVLFVLLIAISVLGAGVVGGDEPDERPIDVDTDQLEVYLQAQKTAVDHDETIIFTHSVTNYVTNDDPLTVQLILQAPSGSDVFSSAGVTEGSGSQFTVTTTLDPGDHESMRIHVDPNEPGVHNVTGQAVYFFGEDRQTGEGVEVEISVTQHPPPPSTSERVATAGSTLVKTPLGAYHWLTASLTAYMTVNGYLNPIAAVIYMGLIVGGSVVLTFLCMFILTITWAIFGNPNSSDSEFWADVTVATAILISLFGPIFFALDFSGGHLDGLLLPRLLAAILTTIPPLAILFVVLVCAALVNRRLCLIA